MKDSQHSQAAAPRLFQTLAADGAAAEGDQLSRTRKLFVLFITGLLLVAAPLAWAGSAAGADGSGDAPQAVLNKSGGHDGDGSSGDDDDDTTTGEDSATTTGTRGDDADTGTGKNTRGDTGEKRDAKTGKETGAKNTDRAGLDTGVSTRGETDPGDKTGKTERR